MYYDQCRPVIPGPVEVELLCDRLAVVRRTVVIIVQLVDLYDTVHLDSLVHGVIVTGCDGDLDSRESPVGVLRPVLL